MWHIFNKHRQEKQGPFDYDAIKLLVFNNTICQNTLVWKAGMGSWAVITDTELKDLFPIDTPPPIPAYEFTEPPPLSATEVTPPLFAAEIRRDSHNISTEIEQLETWFKIYWICLAAGIPLCIIYIGLLPVLASWILSLIMLHRFWKTIQSAESSTTPDKAIGFLFIPFFNLYWIFIAFWGLAKDTNRYISQRGIRAQKVNEDLVLSYCILSCASFISIVFPPLGILLGVALLVIWIIMIRAFKQTTVAILKANRQAMW